jgi:hypothetical protein
LLLPTLAVEFGLQEQTQTKSEEWFDETKKNQLEDLAGTVT